MKERSRRNASTLKQCPTCPWKIDADVNLIPNYVPKLHERLTCTIAKPGEMNLSGPLRLMACHYSKTEAEIACAGWMHQQLGIGNNVGLRFRVMRGLLPVPEVDGPQHETFEATLWGGNDGEDSELLGANRASDARARSARSGKETRTDRRTGTVLAGSKGPTRKLSKRKVHGTAPRRKRKTNRRR